jgi:hypothetical protein
MHTEAHDRVNINASIQTMAYLLGILPIYGVVWYYPSVVQDI